MQVEVEVEVQSYRKDHHRVVMGVKSEVMQGEGNQPLVDGLIGIEPIG
jgi:hypothetical protein